VLILFIQFYPNPTPEYHELARELRARGHTVWVGSWQPGKLIWEDGNGTSITQSGPGDRTGRSGWKAILCSLKRRSEFVGFMLRVRGFITETHPDIVQVNPAITYWIGLLPLLMPGRIHFALDFRQLGQRGDVGWIACLRNSLANWENAFYSRYIYDCTFFQHRLAAKKILGEKWPRWSSVVPAGISKDFAFQHVGGKPNNVNRPVRFIYVGVISRIRQIERILFAVQHVLQMTDKFCVTFAGPDASQGYYAKMIRELGLSSVVAIEPPVEHNRVPALLSEYDVALAYVPDRPLDWHYQPTLKVLEYRALGLPIIASDNPPNREFIQDGLNGLLVHNMPEDLAKAMLTFINDRTLLQRCQERALSMRQSISCGQVAGMYEEIYKALINRR
jgi:glycosyltransferase involved in cell wall biosynthesis